MPVRVIGLGGGTSHDVLQGVLYAAGLENDSGLVPSTPADIINLSLGHYGYSDTEQLVYDEVREAGAIVVAAAGNEQTSETSFPAGYAGVISVAALGPSKERAPYSNFGGTVDVSAPGGDGSQDTDGDGYADEVLSADGDDSSGLLRPTYGSKQGTSMAAPHVAGVLALMKAANPSFVTPDNVDTLLVAGALTEDLGPGGRDDVHGYGMIDAYRAVQAALSGTVPTTLSVSPAVVSFLPGETTQSFDLVVNGSGSLSITGVSSGAAWVNVTQGGTPLQYNAVVDRTGLANGTHSTTITVEYTADSASTRLNLPVVVRVGTAASSVGHAGYTRVYLYDSYYRFGDPVYTTTTHYRDGAYVFEFEDVAPGTYYVWAGSDSDGDGDVCDDGESCGAYPTLDQWQPIEVVEGGSNRGIDFLTTFPAEFWAAAAGR